MIRLINQQVNQFAVTVRERTTIPIPNYLFRFYHIQEKTNNLIYLPILNTSNRFDLFEINIPIDIILNSGQYLYEVYESEDLLISFQNKRSLENGRMEVLKEVQGNNVKFNAINEKVKFQ